MFHHRIRFSLLAVLAACMLALSGCGGSSTKTMTDTDTGTPPLTVEVKVSLDDVTAPVTAGMAADIAAGMSGVIGDVAFMCAADGAACSVEVTVDADGVAMATATGGTVTASNSAAYTMRIEEEESAKVVATTKEAGTKATAIATEAMAGDDGPGGAAATDDHMIAISRARRGMPTEVKITVQGEDPPEFEQIMDFGDGRTMHVLKMKAEDGNVVEEVMIVGTDIEEPEATAFEDVHDLTVNPETEDGMDFQSVAIAGNNTMIETTGITATGGGELTVPAAVEDDDSTMDVDETVAAFETDATFDGAAGKLTCTGTTDCTVTLDGDGDITEFGNDGWQFTPNPKVTVDVADTDFLHYGFWLKRTTDKDGVLTYDEVETFAGSSLDPSASVGDVTGTAKYEGGAVGVYVKNVYDSEGAIDTATSGQFKADASLTATFGQTVNDPNTTVNEGNTIAPNLLNKVTGTIDKFVLQHGEANEWTVNLAGDIVVNNGMVEAGTANGGGDPGTFSATFHGPTADDTKPTGVVGEFNANFGGGSTVAGGFGASKTE